jgi:hypothetical protein
MNDLPVLTRRRHPALTGLVAASVVLLVVATAALGIKLHRDRQRRFPAIRTEASRWEPLTIGAARAVGGEENASLRMEAELLAIAAEREVPRGSAPSPAAEPTASELASWGVRLRAPDLAGACGEWRLPRFDSAREPLNLRAARVVCSGRGGLTTIAVAGGQAARWYEIGCSPVRGEGAQDAGQHPCAQFNPTDWGGAPPMFAIGPSIGLAGFFDGNAEDSLRLLDLETMREVEHEDALPVCAMAFDQLGGRVAVVGGGRVRVARFDRRSLTLAATTSVSVKDAPPEGPEWERCPLGGSSSGSGTGIGAPLAFLPGDRIALLNGASLSAIDLRTGGVVWTQASAHFGTRLAVSPDGDAIAVWSREALQLFSAFDGAPLSPALTAESDATGANPCAASVPCVAVETFVADGIALVVPQRDGGVVALTETGHFFRRLAPAPPFAGPSRTGLREGTPQAAIIEELPGVRSP